MDQRNVLNAKMYVVGAKNHFFSRVKSCENWPNLADQISSSSFRHHRWGGGGHPLHPLYPSLGLASSRVS